MRMNAGTGVPRAGLAVLLPLVNSLPLSPAFPGMLAPLLEPCSPTRAAPAPQRQAAAVTTPFFCFVFQLDGNAWTQTKGCPRSTGWFLLKERTESRYPDTASLLAGCLWGGDLYKILYHSHRVGMLMMSGRAVTPVSPVGVLTTSYCWVPWWTRVAEMEAESPLLHCWGQ